MLPRIIKGAAFPTLLGIAAVYALATTVGVILLADAMARVPVVWPHVLPAVKIVSALCCGTAA
jgi:hypothetical protein